MEKVINEFKIIELDDGFRIEIKGDKEEIRKMLKGFGPHSFFGHGGSFGNGFHFGFRPGFWAGFGGWSDFCDWLKDEKKRD